LRILKKEWNCPHWGDDDEADIVNFSGFSETLTPFIQMPSMHQKACLEKGSPIGMCGFSMAIGLLVRLNIFEGTIVAFYGIDEWRFLAPIKIGDTLYSIGKVVEKKESRKEGQAWSRFWWMWWTEWGFGDERAS